MKNILIAGLMLLLLTYCENTSSSQEEYGPCVHTYEDPILAIESVTGQQSGEQILRIEIYDITIDDVQKDPSSFTKESSQNVSVQDSTILCTVPCGFGTESGTYQFSARASGYRDTTLAFENVDYEVFRGGCPSSNSGSTTIHFEMKSK